MAFTKLKKVRARERLQEKFLMTFIVSFKKVFNPFSRIYASWVTETLFVYVSHAFILTHKYIQTHTPTYVHIRFLLHSFILLELNLFLHLRTLMTMLLQSKKKSYASFLISVTKAIIRKEFTCQRTHTHQHPMTVKKSFPTILVHVFD